MEIVNRISMGHWQQTWKLRVLKVGVFWRHILSLHSTCPPMFPEHLPSECVPISCNNNLILSSVLTYKWHPVHTITVHEAKRISCTVIWNCPCFVTTSSLNSLSLNSLVPTVLWKSKSPLWGHLWTNFNTSQRKTHNLVYNFVSGFI